MFSQKKIISYLYIALMAMLLAPFISESAYAPFIIGSVIFAIGILVKKPEGALFLTIDASEVVAQFGTHYIDQGQNLSNIKNLPYLPSKTRGIFKLRPQTGDYFRSTNAQMGSVLQPFQKTFTSKGSIKFKPNAFPLFRLKIDLTIFPDDIISGYLGFLAGIPENDRSKWPLIAYIMQVHMPKSQDKDWERKISFGGKFIAPTEGIASPVEESMDGIKEVLKKYTTGGLTNLENGPIDMGVLATDPKDFCTQIEDWVATWPPELRVEIACINMSETLMVRYKKGKRLKYGLLDNFVVDATSKGLLTIEDYPSICIDGYQSHEGSDLIWATPADNCIRPLWRNQLENSYKVESEKRNVHIFTDWFEALEFEVPQLIITNASAELS